MMDDLLLELARDCVDAGDLPDDPEVFSHDGTSSGGVCSMCAEPIRPRAREIGLIAKVHGRILSQTLHQECHGAWLALVTSRMQAMPRSRESG